MPYRSSTILPELPDVKIFLTGQLILEPKGDGSECAVGINGCAPAHHFSFEIRQKMEDTDRPDIIVWRHVGKLMPGGLRIDQEPSSINGVRKFVPTGEFQRDGHQDDRDLRWFVDLESEEFHNGRVKFNGNDIEPGIRIRDGIFYTAIKTDHLKLKVERTSENEEPYDLYEIAAVIGVNIYLGRDQKFKLSWNLNNDVPDELTLAKPPVHSGIKCYEIWINNDPIDIAPDDAATHGELREYYKAVKTVTVPDDENGKTETVDFVHFELDFTPDPQQPLPDLGSPTIPCMPIGGGG